MNTDCTVPRALPVQPVHASVHERVRASTSTHYLGVHEPAGGAAARARIIIQIQRRPIPRLSAQQHETMAVRPLVGMTGDGVATLELRRTHQSACARIQNGAEQVLVEGTRRAVPIGTSSSSFLQSISPREPPSSPRRALPCCAHVCRAQGRCGPAAEGALCR